MSLPASVHRGDGQCRHGRFERQLPLHESGAGGQRRRSAGVCVDGDDEGNPSARLEAPSARADNRRVQPVTVVGSGAGGS